MRGREGRGSTHGADVPRVSCAPCGQGPGVYFTGVLFRKRIAQQKEMRPCVSKE